MDRSSKFSIQIGSVENLSFKNVQPFTRLLILPIVFFCLSFLLFTLRMMDSDVFLPCSISSILFFIGTLYGTLLLWAEHIQINRYGRCSGDADLYFENDNFVYFKQITRKLFSVRFKLSDIEEFRLDKNNSSIYVRVNSEIFENLDGTKSNSIKLNYLGDLSFALMIIEKIASEKNNGKNGGEKVFALLGDIMREVKVARFKNVPITNLYKNITLNQRFNFVNELFKGDKIDYEMTIEKFDNSSKLEAVSLLKEIEDKYNWNSHSSLVLEFSELVNRRFL